jgi:fructokinase
MNKNLKIIGIGEIVWDCLPNEMKLGGAPLNFAYFAGQCGAKASMVSAIGDDELGKQTLEAVRAAGVDTTYVQINSMPTSRVLVTVNADGIPQYEIVENVAWDDIRYADNLNGLISDASAVCWGSLAQRSLTTRSTIASILENIPESCLKVFDINIRQHYYDREGVEDSLLKADILKLNEDELPLVAGLLELNSELSDVAAVMYELIQKYSLKYVVYTCGADFSEVYDNTGLVSHIKTPSVKVADTVGAGDSFTATFITLLLKGVSPVECHAKAVEVSAYVCTQAGAVNPLPEGLL